MFDQGLNPLDIGITRSPSIFDFDFQPWRRYQPPSEPPKEEEDTPGAIPAAEVATVAVAGGAEVEAEAGDVTAAAVILAHLVSIILNRPNPSPAASSVDPTTGNTSVPNVASRTAR